MIAWLVAAQLAIVAQGPGAAASCAPVEITVAARAAGMVPPTITAPASAAVQLLRHSLVTHLDPDAAGHPFAVAEGTFVVAVRGHGRVLIPGVEARVGARRVTSAPIPVELGVDSSGDDDAMVLVRAALDDGRHRGTTDTVYVGQQLDYVVDVLLNAAARGRLRRNPTFFPPDMPAVLAYDVAPQPPARSTGPHCFESLTYRRALFPLFPGPTTIPPAGLTYALPVSPSFFSREETHDLRTDSVRVVAMDPPAAGRPSDFAGAVGQLHASARLGAPTGRMGDPLVLTVRVEGTGNVKLLPRPTIDVRWAAVATGEERVEVDSTGARVRGAKEFDWLLTPRLAGALSVDSVRYPYFDPERATYDVAVTTPLALEVAPASLVTADSAAPPPLGIRTRLREEQGAPWSDRPGYWILLALAPVPAVVRRSRRIRRRRARGLTAARRLQLAGRGGGPVLARELRRLFLDALRERIPGVAPASGRLSLARQLRRAGVTDATAGRAEGILQQLDEVAFSRGGAVDAAPTADVLAVMQAIDLEAVRVHARGTAALAVGALVLVTGLTFALPTGARRSFADGVQAYRAGDFPVALRAFARTAERAPRAEDAWANLGAVAWASHDTARAAAAWQRALRLDPLDAETRARLGTVHVSDVVSEVGYVPPLPPDLLALAALLLWLAAWLLLALPPAGAAAVVRPVAGGAVVLAVLGLLGTLELHERLLGRNLGVLRHGLLLVESPLPGARTVASGGAGEVVRFGAREGSWMRVVLDGARAGWVPVSSVLPLERAAAD